MPDKHFWLPVCFLVQLACSKKRVSLKGRTCYPETPNDNGKTLFDSCLPFKCIHSSSSIRTQAVIVSSHRYLLTLLNLHKLSGYQTSGIPEQSNKQGTLTLLHSEWPNSAVLSAIWSIRWKYKVNVLIWGKICKRGGGGGGGGGLMRMKNSNSSAQSSHFICHLHMQLKPFRANSWLADDILKRCFSYFSKKIYAWQYLWIICYNSHVMSSLIFSEK